MSASTNLIGDMKTVLSNGPSTVTKQNAIAAAGPIVDYPGETNGVILMLEEADVKITGLLLVTDQTVPDPNYARLNTILQTLIGGSPTSATLIALILAAEAAGPSALTAAAAIAPAGPGPVDYVGMLKSIHLCLSEAKNALGGIGGTGGLIGLTDASTDAANLALLQNVLLALA